MAPVPIFGAQERVPTSIGQLSLRGLLVYPEERLGARFHFANQEGVRADTFLYNPTGELLPIDLRHPLLADLMRQAVGEVIEAGRRGLYLNLDVIASHYLHVPEGAAEPFALWAAFRYCQAAGEGAAPDLVLSSHLALRVDGGHVNKVRYTYPADREALEMPAFVAFLDHWAHAVRLAAQPDSSER